jgi:hypothetical protein
MFKLLIYLIPIYILIFMLMCKDDSMGEIYRIPKKSKGNLQFNKNQKKIIWTKPANWTEKKLTSMRLASFEVTGIGKKDTADISVVLLKGKAGGLIANINRWRNQIGLESVSKDKILAQINAGKSKLGKFKWIKISNPKNPKMAIWGAILPAKNRTLFIKMAGPLKILELNSNKFLSFCKSLRASP